MRSMQRLPMSHGMQFALLGFLIFLVGVVLLTVSDPLAVAGMIVGGLMVFSGLLWTLRTRSDDL
jgi:hypothetical protein